MTPDQFLARCPAMWHLAPAGAWETIRETGLRTAAQLIDASDADDARRAELHSTLRPEQVALTVDGTDVFLRDQAALLKADITKVLAPGVTVEDWVGLLNQRIYLYTDRAVMQKSLDKFLENDGPQDVIAFSPRRLVEQVLHQIELTAQSSATIGRRTDPPKGKDTFLSITRFANKKPAEVTIIDGLDDLTPIVRVERYEPDGTRTALDR